MQEIKNDLKTIKQSQARTEIDIAMIKVDVAHHIKRSDAADTRLQKLEYTLIGLLVTIIGAALAKWIIS